MIQTLLLQHDAPTVLALPEGAVFPLKTVSDVEEMEQKLADPTFHKEVVSLNQHNHLEFHHKLRIQLTLGLVTGSCVCVSNIH